MRLSTSLIYSSSISSYQKGYANIVKTQQQISSGERIQTPADDPVGAARLLQLEQQQALLTQYQGNLTTATNSLSQEEGILNSINNLLQKARNWPSRPVAARCPMKTVARSPANSNRSKISSTP